MKIVVYFFRYSEKILESVYCNEACLLVQVHRTDIFATCRSSDNTCREKCHTRITRVYLYLYSYNIILYYTHMITYYKGVQSLTADKCVYCMYQYLLLCQINHAISLSMCFN